MASQLLDTYVVLQVRPAEGALFLDYSDHTGATLRAFRSGAAHTRHEDVELFLHPDVRARINALVEASPMQVGAHGTGRTPVAVFVRGGEPSLLASVERALASLGVDPDGIQVVLMATEVPRPREPFTIPLHITSIGGAAPLLDELRSHSWTQRWEVAAFALQFERLAGLPEHATPATEDVLILPDGAYLELLARWPEARRPRLLIAAGFSPGTAQALSAGAAWLVLPEVASPSSRKLLHDFLYALFHDHALHEALKTALRMQSGPPPQAYLIADPASVLALRLWDAMHAVAAAAEEVEQRVPRATIEKHAARPADNPFQSLKWRLRGGFGRESDGIVPMAEVAAELSSLESSLSAPAAPQTSRGPDAGPEPREPEEPAPAGEARRFDVTLLRTHARTNRGIYVEPEETLAAGATYRMRVRIGRRSSVSIVSGDVPAIDPLLPPPPDDRGHLLHVVVYPIDFTPGEPQIRELRLPVTGSSNAVELDVTAPAKSGPARLRIAIYYDRDLTEDGVEEDRNHLVQSFLLQTLVTDAEEWKGSGTTAVSLEFSRTSAFANVGAFGKRVASVAVNESADGTHLLMLKRGSKAANVGLAQPFLQQQTKETRELLWSASADGELPRFPTGEAGDPEAFANAIRSLAEKGSALRLRVFGSDAGDGAVQSMLRDVRKAVDQIVQVVRLEQDFYFPWAVLYDFATPPIVHGAPPYPVCEGFLRRDAAGKPYSCADCLADCLHPDKREAYCAYGFWGTRLQVEQTLHRLRKNDDVVPPLQPIGDGCVLVATALDTATAQAFPADLTTALGGAWVKTFAEPDSFLDTLWKTDGRPAILVILGHYQTLPVTGQREGPRIAVPGGFLVADDVLQRVADDDVWSDPHSLVIIAACESAGEDLTTMNGYITAFAAARAGAVLGTETSVFESLARRFATSISKAVIGGERLGEAVLAFRRELLLERNPLGLVFSAFGDADLRRAVKGEPA
jgi:hypothetical protein